RITPELETLQSALADRYELKRELGQAGYLDIDAADGAVYALFSGRTDRGFGADMMFGRFVHVFEWDGTLREAYELDREALALAVSADEGTVFTAIRDPLPAVMAYEIERKSGANLQTAELPLHKRRWHRGPVV
ncbi:MAG: TolB-like 6-bladed beta-propeller domain-containing protein, partial [Gemmatimonadetes bacterium]|nr:TolB-like 6-bladed beta-propeller domain-containing protein [Gemmatimonadota bacterium]